jgi:predicted transcriptional regulator
LTIVTAQALGGGNIISQVIEVKGCPAFVTTSCSPMMDEQMSTRVWILSTDESVEQTKRILEFEANKEKYPKLASVKEEKEAIRKALRELKPVKVLIPYADFIDFPFNRIRARRDFPKLLALIKVLAYLHQYQRPRLVLKGEEYVVATFADYSIACALAGKVFRPTVLGLPEGVLKVFDVCRRLSEQSVEITSRTVTESCEYSQKTVQKYLNELVRARLLLKDESQREYRYSLIEAEDGRLELNLSLMERFGEDELEKWISSIVDGEKNCGISYEEMKANVYNPLPSIYSSTFKDEAKESLSKPEEAENGRFNQSLHSISELDKTLKDLAKHFGGSIPMDDALRELKARGFDEPEVLIKRLLSEGRIYEARKGVLSVSGDFYD